MSIFNGTSGDDLSLTGTSAADIFYGTEGNDTIDGRDGTDRISYSGDISSYTINYRLGNIIIEKPNGARDTLSNVEQISFGDYVYSLKEVQLVPAGGFTFPNDFRPLDNGQTLFLQDQYSSASNTRSENIVVVSADLHTSVSYSLFSAGGFDPHGVLFVTGTGSAVSIAQNQADNAAPVTLNVSQYQAANGGSVTNLGNVSLAGLIPYNSWYVNKLVPLKTVGDDFYLGINSYNGSGSEFDYIKLHVDSTTHLVTSSQKVFGLSSIDAGSGLTTTMATDASAFILANGNISVSIIQYVGGSHKIYNEVVDPLGVVVGTPQRLDAGQNINAYLTSSHLAGGNVFVGWVELHDVIDPNGGTNINGTSYSQYGYLRGTIVNSADPTQITHFDVNQNPENNTIWTGSCALSNGSVAVVWASNSDGSGCGVYGRIFSALGVAVGDQFQVNASNWGNQTSPKIVADSDGGFLCYWNDENNGGVFQKFDALGRPKLMNITGTDGADVIFANDGDQQIMGGMGEDEIHAGAGDDILLGGVGGDTLYGGTGNNVVDGGTGIDTVSYSDLGSSASLIVNLVTGIVTKNNGATAEEDQLIAVENVTGSSGSDTITGSSADNTIYSGSGDDFVDAGAGNDLIIGGDGAGNDTYNGGTGIDEIKYTSARASIIVNLGAGSATSISSNDAAGIGNDTLSNIENLISGNYSDVITGSNAANLIYGMGGDDEIDGGAGQDTAGYNISRYSAKVTRSGNEYVVTSTDGIDYLNNIESLQFTDGTISLATLFAGMEAGSTKQIALYRGGQGGIIQGNSSTEFVKAEYSIASSEILGIGKSADGKNLIIKTASGSDLLKSVDSVLFSDGTYTLNDILNSSYVVPLFQSSGGTGGYALPSLYSGPASLGLKYELIETADNAVVTGSTDNDFIKVASSNSIGKAVDGGGNDVIDGGVGSTFVTGGTDHNTTFFLDGRAPGTSWSTITDFRAGVDKVTIWGFVKVVSSVDTSFANYNSEGAEGYQGLTLHFKNLLPDGQTSGSNANLNSITLTGHTLQEFGVSSLADLNNQINAGTNAHILVGSTQDSLGTHSYLYFH